jgi:hypothetical protein
VVVTWIWLEGAQSVPWAWAFSKRHPNAQRVCIRTVERPYARSARSGLSVCSRSHVQMCFDPPPASRVPWRQHQPRSNPFPEFVNDCAKSATPSETSSTFRAYIVNGRGNGSFDSRNVGKARAGWAGPVWRIGELYGRAGLRAWHKVRALFSEGTGRVEVSRQRSYCRENTLPKAPEKPKRCLVFTACIRDRSRSHCTEHSRHNECD